MRVVALMQLLLALLFSSAQAQSVLVFEQPPDPAGGVAPSSWYPPDGSDSDSYVYDSFVLGASTPITEVRWRGGYQYLNSGPVVDFVISFYATNVTGNEPDSGLPGEHDNHLARYRVGGTAGQTYAGTYGGIVMYDYHYDLPQPFQATGGEKFWIQIEGETAGLPFWGVAWGTGGNGTHFRFYNHIFNFWPHDTAFSLYTTGQPTYSITTAASPPGAGTTIGDGEYPPASQATVVAIGNIGWGFVNWTENGVPVSNSASYTFTVNSDRDLVANFMTAYTVTTSAQPFIGGTTDGDGLYVIGSQVTVDAFVNPSWEFVNWTEWGVPVSSSASYTFAAAANRTLVANFALAAGVVLFDFDDAPLYANLPLDITQGGLTAHFWAPGTYGYYIQYADFPGTAPVGFSGRCVYPSSLYTADLAIDFTDPITDFSIMFSPQEYNCNDTATLRVTAHLGGVYVGTKTAISDNPGTWPSGTLTFSSAQGFEQVRIHYDSDPPTCQDFIRALMADNLIVTVSNDPTAVVGSETSLALAPVVSPNPFGAETTIRFGMERSGPVSVTVYDLSGRLVRTLASENLAPAGLRSVRWDGRGDDNRRLANGVYFCRIHADGRTTASRVVLLRTH